MDSSIATPTKLKVIAFLLVLGGLVLAFLFAKDTRNGSGTVEMGAETLATSATMGTQWFRHRYIWLLLREGETVTLDASLKPEDAIASIRVRPLNAPWKLQYALLCNATASSVFRAPASGAYVFNVRSLRAIYGGSEPSISMRWHTASTEQSPVGTDDWKSLNLLSPGYDFSSELADQIRHCSPSA